MFGRLGLGLGYGLVSGLGLGLGLVSVLGLVLGLIILGTLSRYYCAHSITPCFDRSVGTITTAYLLVNKLHIS